MPTVEDRNVEVGQGIRVRGLETQIDWSGDPQNPRNWSASRKLTVGIVCSASQLVTTMSASMVAPSLNQISNDLHLSTAGGQVAFSSFFLGLGFAPFVVAPLAETYGRRPIWIAGNVWYIVWNSLCPVGSSAALMIIGRLMSASGASVGITLTSAVFADMYTAGDRGKATAMASLLPYIGPALGPIVGGLAAQHISWPWLFWILSIFDAVCLITGVLVLKETYAPVLLPKGNARVPRDKTQQLGRPEKLGALKNVLSKILKGLWRPIRLLVRRPIIQIIALATAVDFGIYTLVLSTYADLWITSYGQSETTASLHYISIAVGAIGAGQLGGPLMDIIWRRLTARRPQHHSEPENRVPFMVLGLLIGIAGLFWYAWAAEATTPWPVVDIGVFLFTIGTFMFSQGLLAYMIDEVSSARAASANAATRMGSYVLGFAFPIFAPKMYQKLGYGWGNSLLGFLLLALAAPVPFILWFWGHNLRALGRMQEEEDEKRKDES